MSTTSFNNDTLIVEIPGNIELQIREFVPLFELLYDIEPTEIATKLNSIKDSSALVESERLLIEQVIEAFKSLRVTPILLLEAE